MSEPAAAGRVSILVALVLLLTGCERAPQHRSETLYVFGSQTRIELVDAPTERADAVLARIAAELTRMHRDWHPWEPGPLTELNAAFAAGESAPLPPSIRGLIERSRPIAMRSDGLFNPAIGRLVGLWGFHTSDYPISAPPPDAAALEAWRRQVPALSDLVFDGDRVSSRNPALQLDFAAIAEGFAAERIALLLRDAGIAHALVTLGGDVHALGRAAGRPWRVGLRDPFGEAQAVFATIDLHDGEALFSSGNYARFRSAADGARWPHVVDPRTGLPARGVAAVSVLHDDPLLADAAATALMVGGPARFADLLNRMGLRCALLLTEQDELMVTTAMAERLQLQRQPTALGAPIGAAGRCGERTP